MQYKQFRCCRPLVIANKFHNGIDACLLIYCYQDFHDLPLEPCSLRYVPIAEESTNIGAITGCGFPRLSYVPSMQPDYRPRISRKGEPRG